MSDALENAVQEARGQNLKNVGNDKRRHQQQCHDRTRQKHYLGPDYEQTFIRKPTHEKDARPPRRFIDPAWLSRHPEMDNPNRIANPDEADGEAEAEESNKSTASSAERVTLNAMDVDVEGSAEPEDQKGKGRQPGTRGGAQGKTKEKEDKGSENGRARKKKSKVTDADAAPDEAGPSDQYAGLGSGPPPDGHRYWTEGAVERRGDEDQPE